MPLFNLRIIIIVVIFSLFCSMRTSVREQVLLHSYRKIQGLSLVRPSEEDVFEGALEGMTAKLREDKYGDHYAAFENPQAQAALHDQLVNDLVGLGVAMELDDKTQEVILFPLPKSPALESGVQYGDVLLKIGGQAIKGLTMREVSEKLQGEEGTKIRLTVRHDDSPKTSASENEAEIEVTRKRQRLPSVVGDRLNADGTWNYTLETSPEIGYLGLRTTFSDTTAAEVRQALESLADAKAVILDLRNNPGGYMNAAIDVCNFFLDKGIIVSTTTEIVSAGTSPPPAFSDRTVSAAGHAIWHKPVAVLINHNTASAAEIVAACLQDHKIATVIGTRSYGKGTVQELTALPFHLGLIRLTKAQYLRPSRQNINRTPTMTDTDIWGVSPDAGFIIELAPQQESALDRVRNLRMIVPENQLAEQTKHLIQRIESEKENLKTPKLSGNLPYYDSQIDKAVEMLKEKK